MIHAHSTPDQAVEALAQALVARLSSLEGTLRVVLPGGSTPKRLYRLLARDPFRRGLPWERIRWVLSDERGVAPDHPDSNYGMVWNTLWKHASVSPDHIVRFRGEWAPERAVAEANARLAPWAAADPMFHLVLLGLGEDGHTASIFPAKEVPDFGTFPVAHVFHPEKGHRMTLTPDALSRTGALWFLALGSSKADAVAGSLAAEPGSPRHPLSYLPLSRSEWFLDRAAAAQVENASS